MFRPINLYALVICRSHDVDATEVKERTAFWGALCRLLLLMPSPEATLSRAALPEDWQLRAFGPLNAAHQHLDFQLPRTEKVCVRPLRGADCGGPSAEFPVFVVRKCPQCPYSQLHWQYFEILHAGPCSSRCCILTAHSNLVSSCC